MRHRLTIAGIVMFAFAGVVAFLVASVAATTIEEKSRADVVRTLGLNGIDWAETTTSGLQVFLSGEAPDEAARFHAIREAGRVVDAARVIDMMSIHVPEPIKPPTFSVEILRNDDGISLIGLVPTDTGRAGISDRVAAIGGVGNLTELLDEANFPEPALWMQSLDYGIRALEELPRSKISIGAGTVDIVASSESAVQKRDLETRLRAQAPEGVVVSVKIAAPRPVITPYTLRFVIDTRGARFDACTSDTEAGAKMIEAAARQAGLVGPVRCTIGLGVPSPEWDRAASLAVVALGEIGRGTVTFSDADISLVGEPGMDATNFDLVSGRLQTNLPSVFSLQATLLELPKEDGSDASGGPPEFIATLSPEGLLQLRGPVGDQRTRMAAQNLARAQFGGVTVSDALRLREDVPLGWGLRVFAALEALSELKNGLARVTPDRIEITGNTGNADGKAEIAALLAEHTGGLGQFEIDVIYREALDPLASIPTPQECVDAVGEILAAQKITFAPSSADINDEGREAVEQIVEIMKDCEHVPMEVAGHTDSQGREIMNKELSQARADAVVNALLARRVLTTNLTSHGYGEERPIADNETEVGREANRRIEFSLIEPLDAHSDHDHEQEKIQELVADEGADPSPEEQAAQEPEQEAPIAPGEDVPQADQSPAADEGQEAAQTIETQRPDIKTTPIARPASITEQAVSPTESASE